MGVEQKKKEIGSFLCDTSFLLFPVTPVPVKKRSYQKRCPTNIQI